MRGLAWGFSGVLRRSGEAAGHPLKTTHRFLEHSHPPAAPSANTLRTKGGLNPFAMNTSQSETGHDDGPSEMSETAEEVFEFRRQLADLEAELLGSAEVTFVPMRSPCWEIWTWEILTHQISIYVPNRFHMTLVDRTRPRTTMQREVIEIRLGDLLSTMRSAVSRHSSLLRRFQVKLPRIWRLRLLTETATRCSSTSQSTIPTARSLWCHPQPKTSFLVSY